MKIDPKSISWSSYRGPNGYAPEKVPLCLESLESLSSDSGLQRTYDNVLSTIGNNHAGTLYEAAVHAVDFVIEIALHASTASARGCALEILTDLLSFESDSTAPNAKERVLDKITRQKDRFTQRINLTGETKLNQSRAQTLLKILGD